MSILTHSSSIADKPHSTHSSDITSDAFQIDALISQNQQRASTTDNSAVNEAVHRDLSPDARELALEIDRYKFRHRRRFINYEEILSIVKTLGYRKEIA